MAILSPIEQRHVKGKVILGIIYGILVLGAASMVYPFLLMISGSMKSEVDITVLDPVPGYFFDDETLYRKFLESKYSGTLKTLNAFTQLNLAGWQEELPYDFPVKTNARLVLEYGRFLEETRFPEHWFILGHTFGSDFDWVNKRRVVRLLREHYDGDLDRLNRENVMTFQNWAIEIPQEQWEIRRYEGDQRPMMQLYQEFKYARPPGEWAVVNVDGIFVKDYLRREYNDLEEYNKGRGRGRGAFEETTLTARAPKDPIARRDWVRFVCRDLNMQFIEALPGMAEHFREFLAQRKYEGDIRILNEAYGTKYADFSGVPLPDARTPGAPLSDWALFLERVSDDPGKTDVLAENLTVATPCTAWRTFLRGRFEDVDSLNAAYGTTYGNFDDCRLPVWQYDYEVFQQGKGSFRWECAKRNYLKIVSYVVLHGRGLVNSVIYCVLAVATALLVNPLAAYALSRFGLPSTYKILLFLLATMAFPVEVTMIPSFLLLRKLDLLNTFFALVLPGAANGFGIFLLKGFFDSLPKDLYESATIDGAGEWTMFWQITMAMSKPILAVIALGSFTAAYGAFMFAMVICPDRKMWTLMVYLYQLQSGAHQGVVYASLVLGAIPTFLVFLFCQKIIMRGIVVPTEK